MNSARASTAAGRLELLLASADFLDAARELAAERGVNRTRHAERIRFMDREAWLKAGALSGRARVRHGLMHCALRTPPPRVREAQNLEWLAARSFQVPRPLAAGWLGGAFPSWQFLVTEFVEATALDPVLRASAPAARAALLGELARETARMHAQGFVHRDLFWRNVLVTPATSTRRLVFIDAWRGGKRLQWRGPAYDLACLFLEGPSLLGADEIHAWLASYAAERQLQGNSIRANQLWSAANAARRALLERARAEPGRWRVPEPAVQEFDFVAAARTGSKPALP